MTETRDVYLNPLQQTMYYAGAKDNRLEAARRYGKTSDRYCMQFQLKQNIL